LRVLDANFIVHVLTLKGLETDTLYLVFKHRFQIVFGLPYRRSNSPQANGDINQRPLLCQATLTYLLIYPGDKKAPQSPRNFRGKATLYRSAIKFPVFKPLDALSRAKEEWAL
jgi:hypothetical protein